MAVRLESSRQLRELRQSINKETDLNKPCIIICGGTGCRAYNCEKVISSFEKDLSEKGIDDKVRILTSGCHGFCELGPLVVIRPQGIFYKSVSVEDTKEIIEETIQKGKIVNRLLYKDPATGKVIVYEKDIPFYKGQQRIVLRNNGHIDPTSIEDYLVFNGFAALSKALFELRSSEIIDEIERSGLRGRGGGGFPTGLKWKFAAQSPGDIKYVVCNADEGDPGAYMDRSILEGNPFSIVEGMIIAGKAIGAHEGYVYVRAEYPLAIHNLTIAINKAREYNLLGDNILGSGFGFEIFINKGSGAFVCGEETALIASLEGREGTPKPKPPFPAQMGLWGKPTLINNVETFGNIPIILDRGAEWFSSIGTEGSKGTKVFSLVGKINNTGLVEVPMGTTLRQIVYDIGGGIRGGKKYKAVQTGGPSGGCIPESMLDLAIDFDRLSEVGSMMGSGGMIVMDENSCMVDIARYFLSFLEEESCGKCVPCREGITQMLDLVTRITEGKGTLRDLEVLMELAVVIKDAALCALGQTSPNPVLSTIRHFEDEYLAHIKDKRCPAKVCKALITYTIDKDKCIGCTKCARQCPKKAISGEKKKPHEIDQSKCIKCGICFQSCPVKAVEVE
ncbi:MAG: NADH-quinone oxidoreductase subunit NuoF [bacterium]